MNTYQDPLIRKMMEAVLGKQAFSDQELRLKVNNWIENNPATFQIAEMDSPALQTYLEKVAKYAYKVMDSDIKALKENGFTEDEIFELTVTASVSAGIGRLKKGLDLFN